MKIIDLLIEEKKIVGIEINDSVIRLAYFKKKDKPEKDDSLPKNEIILIEERLSKNIVSCGVVTDKEFFEKTLRDIWGKKRLDTLYAVVSIPEDKVYSHVFSFPKTMDEREIEPAVNLTIDFQLPFKRSDVYVGWEKIGDHSDEHIEILVSAIPKNVADVYIQALNNAHIDVLALESHLASISRSIKIEPSQSLLITKTNQDSFSIFELKNNALRFSRTVPFVFLNKEGDLKNEIEKIKSSLETENNESITEQPIEAVQIKDAYLKYPEITSVLETPSDWFISIGALARGEIKNSEDTQISLLPVGVVEAYEYQKTKAFVTLVSNILITVSLFFLCTFSAAYLFVFSLSQEANNATTYIVSPPSQNTINKESLVKKVNALTQASKTILSNTPNWSLLIDEIDSRTIDGITITNLSIPSINDTISIVGKSKDRITLNQFRKTLQDSMFLTKIELPITNLEQKKDIPFVISFRIKDPHMLFYK